MAPIDPNQLLAAFSPLLTTTGGIKNASEVPRLSRYSSNRQLKQLIRTLDFIKTINRFIIKILITIS
jgi:hypothetical protein